MPDSLFPARLSGESPLNYFVRVHRWRCEYGIPQQVYAHIRPSPGPFQLPEDEELGETEGTHQEPGEVEVRNAQCTENGQPLASNDQAAKQMPAHGIQVSLDFFKPQYIDFRNPLLVRLFGKIVANLDRYVATLEECLPAASELPRYQDKAYVTELILQLNFPDEHAPAAQFAQLEEPFHEIH